MLSEGQITEDGKASDTLLLSICVEQCIEPANESDVFLQSFTYFLHSIVQYNFFLGGSLIDFKFIQTNRYLKQFYTHLRGKLGAVVIPLNDFPSLC